MECRGNIWDAKTDAAGVVLTLETDPNVLAWWATSEWQSCHVPTPLQMRVMMALRVPLARLHKPARTHPVGRWIIGRYLFGPSLILEPGLFPLPLSPLVVLSTQRGCHKSERPFSDRLGALS